LFFTFSVSPCDSVTCQNEGTCVVEAGLAVCYCKGDYSGATCAGNCTYLLYKRVFLCLSTHKKSNLKKNHNFVQGSDSKYFYIEIFQITCLSEI